MYLVNGSLLQIVLKITSRKICCAADEAFTDSSFIQFLWIICRDGTIDSIVSICSFYGASLILSFFRKVSDVLLL